MSGNRTLIIAAAVVVVLLLVWRPRPAATATDELVVPARRAGRCRAGGARDRIGA